MKALRTSLFIVCLIALYGCSGGSDGAKSTSVISAAQLETSKLQTALKAEPAYKLDDSEIALLQKEGILTEADKAQLQAIQ